MGAFGTGLQENDNALDAIDTARKAKIFTTKRAKAFSAVAPEKFEKFLNDLKLNGGRGWAQEVLGVVDHAIHEYMYPPATLEACSLLPKPRTTNWTRIGSIRDETRKADVKCFLNFIILFERFRESLPQHRLPAN